MDRACIFVDGENFRFSINKLFKDQKFGFQREDYLPEADWHTFYKSLAENCGCKLLRAYWYVTENIDFHPWKIPHPWENKRRLFRRSPDLRVRLDAIEGDDRDALKDIANQLDDKRAIMKVGSRAGKRSRIQ